MKDCKHIECEGCIVNIREGLSDRSGRKVTSIEILPDEKLHSFDYEEVRR